MTGLAQSYQFFSYGVSEGLCDKFAYTINQDQKGFLWIGTSQGLCRFDGTAFEQNFKGDSIPPSIAHASLLDSRGRLWFGHENGLVSVLVDGSFRLISPGDNNRSKINAIREDHTNGNIMVLCQQSGVLVIDPDLQIIHERNPADPNDPFAGKFLYDFQITPDGHLLIATQDGLSIFRYDQELETYISTGIVNDMQYIGVQELVSAVNQDEYWAGTEDEGVFRITGKGYDPEGYVVSKIGEEFGFAYSSISSIVFNGERRAWLSGAGEGIFRVDLDAEGNPYESSLFNSAI